MVEEIAPSELRRRLDEEERDLQVVDVRGPAAFREGHVPGAINLPLPEFHRRVDEVDWGAEIVVVCPVGRSSLRAARLLEAYEGVDDDAVVLNLEGGYEAYDYELVSGPA